MNLSVVGSRSLKDNAAAMIEAIAIISRIIEKYDITCFVSGGAQGPDKWGEATAAGYGISRTIYKPEWEKYGKSAGIRRNLDIINDSDIVLIFWDGKSKGTSHDIMLARKCEKQYALYIWAKTDEWSEIESTIT